MSDNDFETPPPSEDAGPGEPLPPPPPPVAQRPLLRRDSHKHLAGVAGGLADYLGVEASVMRVAFVVLGAFGVGLPLYIVGWLAMPSPAMPQSYVERWFGRSPNPAALVAIAAGLIVIVAVSDAPGGDGVGWGLALLFGGWLLYRADSRSAFAGTPGTAAPAAAPPSATGTWHGAGGTAAAAPAWTPPPVPPASRPKSMLGRLTVGTTIASLGGAALLEQLGSVSLEASQYVALALTVIGLGLIVGAWVGRAYGLVWLGILLLPVLLAASVVPGNIPSGAGDFSYAPSDLSELEDSYDLGLGRMELDLSAIDFEGATETVDVSVGAGETEIIVPDDVTVSVSAKMSAGQIELFGQETQGSPFEGPVTAVDEGTGGGGRLELTIDNGVGEITVQRSTEEF